MKQIIKKFGYVLLTCFMVLTMLPMNIHAAAELQLSLTYAQAYDDNHNPVTSARYGTKFTLDADEIEGMEFVSWNYRGRVMFQDRYSSTTTATMGEQNTHVWATYRLVSDVWLNTVEMKAGYYLANGSKTLTKVKPEGGYAYYDGNTNLTLHNYKCEMDAPSLDSVKTDNYNSILCTTIPLNVHLEGENELFLNKGDCVYVSVVGKAGTHLTFEGTENDSLHVKSGDDVGIRCMGGVTINGGNILTRGIGTDAGVDITVNDGSLVSYDIYCGTADRLVINGGYVESDELYNIRNITINSGRITGTINEKVANVTLGPKVEGYGSENEDGSDAVEFVRSDFGKYQWIDLLGTTNMQKYNVEVEGGMSSVSAAYPGSKITIVANQPEEGMDFDHWESPQELVFRDVKGKSTTFVMPSENVKLKAIYRKVATAITNFKVNAKDFKNVELQWDEVNGADEYAIYRKTPTADELQFVDKTSETSYQTTQITGKEYQYKVVALTNDVEGLTSKTLSCTTMLTGKPQLSIEKAGNSRFTLSWTKVDGATRYIVYRKRNDDKMKKVLTLGAKEVSYTTAEMPNGDYQFILKAARYDSKDRVMSDSSNTVKGSVATPTPSITLTAGIKQVKVSWDKVEGATNYDVYYATSKDGKYTKLTSTTSTSYTVKSLTSGKKYYFKVQGYKTYKSGTDIQYKVYTNYSSVKSATAK